MRCAPVVLLLDAAETVPDASDPGRHLSDTLDELGFHVIEARGVQAVHAVARSEAIIDIAVICPCLAGRTGLKAVVADLRATKRRIPLVCIGPASEHVDALRAACPDVHVLPAPASTADPLCDVLEAIIVGHAERRSALS